MTLDQQYAFSNFKQRISQAVIAAGLDLDDLGRGSLALLEDFHTMGRIATTQLVELVEIKSCDEVLDAGSGVGGTARYLVDHFGCKVTTIDLSKQYCEVSRWLNHLVGLDGQITVHNGDVTKLPFSSGSFTVIMSQHVQMNVVDKSSLYAEARRVLRPGGRLAIWDITAGAPGKLEFPLPWADQPSLSHLVSGDVLRATIECVGFAITHWSDMTEEAVLIMENLLQTLTGPLGLHVFVDDFVVKMNNLVRGLSTGRLRVVRAIAEARS